MTGQSAESSRPQTDNREYIWLVALYEFEARAEELLDRLRAIGVDTGEATTVRVEIDDQLRQARYVSVNDSALSPLARSAVTGALLGGAVALLIGLVVYALGWFSLPVFWARRRMWLPRRGLPARVERTQQRKRPEGKNPAKDALAKVLTLQPL